MPMCFPIHVELYVIWHNLLQTFDHLSSLVSSSYKFSLSLESENKCVIAVADRADMACYCKRPNLGAKQTNQFAGVIH